MSDGALVQPSDVLRVTAGRAEAARDAAAVEEPLEIRLGNTPFVVIMRTPGADRELAAGFLLSEGIVREPDDLGAIRHCTDPDAGEGRNILNVTLAGSALARLDDIIENRRAVASTSSCGVCGRRSIDDLLRGRRRVDAPLVVRHDLVAALPQRLRGAQAAFDETGGLHAAGLFTADGTLVACAEDVGRHNAVDKVIGGQLLMKRVPLADRILFVSGRTSFELVQKAVVAGIPVLAAVSAPSSLAIDFARDAGLTLLGFVRGETFNIYSHPHRIGL